MNTPSTPTERVLEALRAGGVTVRRSGDGWASRCPAHDDKNPSLSIGTGENGRCLLHCHTGCETADIVASIGLTMTDLMPDGERPQNATKPRPRPKSGNGSSRQNSFDSADGAIAALERTLGSNPRRWPYHDISGKLVLEVARWDLPSGDKEVRPISARGNRWVIAALPEPRPLLHLPELARLPEGAWVFVVEGEACVNAARAIGVVATTSAGGSQAASKSDWAVMKGKIVVVVPDHDAAGDKYAGDVVRLCLAAGAAEVRVVHLVEQWTGLPPGGDIVDALAAEGGDAEAVRSKIDALAVAAQPVAPGEAADIVLDECPRFGPAVCFPGTVGDVADFFADVARSTQTPPEMAALLGLAIASACICNVACVRGHGDHVEPAPIWAMVLSEPGTRKSAVLSELLKPVLMWEADKAREMRPLIAAAVQRHRITERRMRTLEENAAKADDPDKRALLEDETIRIAQEMGSSPVPTAPVLLASEPTPEALVRQMKENQGRALLASAEGDALDIVQGRYSGVRNYGALLKGHAGDPIRAQRVGRPSDGIDRPALAVALCVQRAAVEAIWSDPQAQGRGLLARFAIISPPDLVGSRDVRPQPIRSAVRQTWQAGLTRLLSFDPSDDPSTPPAVITLSPEADTLYFGFQVRTETSLGFGDLAERRAWGGKLCGLVLRIALTLHALATWGRSGTPGDAPSIDAETMAAAIAWADYLAASERHARLSITEPAEQRVLRRRLALIQQQGGSVSIRTWQRARSLDRAADAEAELDGLVKAGHGDWANPAPGPRGGRPSRQFVLRVHAPPSDTTPPTAAPIAPEGLRNGVSSVSSGSDGGRPPPATRSANPSTGSP